MKHKLATAFSISLMLYGGLHTICYKKFVSFFSDFYGQSAIAFGLGIMIVSITWLICWHTDAIKFTRDENWPYLLISIYLVAFIVKMFM